MLNEGVLQFTLMLAETVQPIEMVSPKSVSRSILVISVIVPEEHESFAFICLVDPLR